MNNLQVEYWRAYVAADGEETAEMLLLLTLPEKMSGNLECKLQCESVECYASLISMQGKNELSIHGHKSNIGGSGEWSLEIEDARILQVSQISHGDQHKEWHASVECGNTTIKQKVTDPSSNNWQSLVFLTENHWLAPHPFQMPNSDGSLDAPQTNADELVRFTLNSLDKEISLVRTYSWRSQENELTRTGDLTAKIGEVDLAEDKALRDRIYGEIDDFLLLAGLATATYSQCVGFSAVGKNGVSINYRRDRAISVDSDVGIDPNNAVVNPGELDEYWIKVYDEFSASTYKDEIRTCLHVHRASQETYLEASFLMLFSALELLLSRHRDAKQIAYVMQPDDWKRRQVLFDDLISKQADLEPIQRKALHENIMQLNRVPLRQAFDDLINSFNIDLTGVWPVFESGNRGLSSVRNLFVHGALMTKDERFPPALALANNHLRWTLEVIILACLGWPRSSTNRHPSALKTLFSGYSDVEKIKLMQNNVSALFSGDAG